MKKPYITEEQHDEIVGKFHDVKYPLDEKTIDVFMDWTGQCMIDDFITENCGIGFGVEWEDEFQDDANMIYVSVRDDLISMFVGR